MKLATLPNGSRDGQLAVVSRDLRRCVTVPELATNLQQALDEWDHVSRRLREVSERLNVGQFAQALEFRPQECLAPLPRAYQWADGSAYVNHVELVRKARGAEMPESFWHDPLMYQGGSDTFLGPCEPIKVADPSWGIDFEAEVVVVTHDVPYGASPDEAQDKILLIGLVNDLSLRNLIPNELGKGFGFFQSKPSSAFAPVFVTPDELGSAWDGRKVHLPLEVTYNGEPFGQANAGVDMTFDFPQLIAHAARTRALGAGTVMGSGTVSNRGADGGPGRPIREGGVGYSCLAEVRMVEKILHDTIETPFMNYGDQVRIEMRTASGASLFGAIEQEVQPL